MCRFLSVHSKNKIKPGSFLRDFSQNCQKSRAPDGDWQGDGWGISWQEKGIWKLHKSLFPIWEDANIFSSFPSSNTFAIHARSSGFPDQKGIIEYNQPYILNGWSFVFNGMVKGVRLSYQLDGKIGAQKILSLLQKFLRDHQPEVALADVNKLITGNSDKIVGMNIGLMNKNKIYALCQYESNASYFGLHFYKNNLISLLSSISFGAYPWQTMRKNEILIL